MQRGNCPETRSENGSAYYRAGRPNPYQKTDAYKGNQSYAEGWTGRESTTYTG